MNEKIPQDYIEFRIQKAFLTLNEVEVQIQYKFWNTAINRMYYACFYAVLALLIKNGVEVASHAGVRQKFGQLFVKENLIDKDLAKLFTDLFEKRHKGDYNDFFDFDEETVMLLYPKAKTFISTINNLINNQ